MKLLKQPLFFFAIIAFIFSACEKEDNNNNNDNDNTRTRCDIITCYNGGNCDEDVCQCPAEWTGEFCDTSAILLPFFKAYKVTTTACALSELNIQFVVREKETNPLVCDLLLSIGCNFRNDKVVRLYTTFQDNNFSTNARDCVYNSIVEATYSASGYFTADSVYITLNTNSQPCVYAGAR